MIPIRSESTCGEVIDGGAKILRIDIRGSDIAGKSAAFSRIRGIKRDRQKTAFGHRLGIKARRLFLHGAERTGNGNSRQFPVDIQGHIQIRNQRNAIAVAETYLAVGYLVAFRKHFIPFLRYIQFFGHDFISVGMMMFSG